VQPALLVTSLLCRDNNVIFPCSERVNPVKSRITQIWEIVEEWNQEFFKRFRTHYLIFKTGGRPFTSHENRSFLIRRQGWMQAVMKKAGAVIY